MKWNVAYMKMIRYKYILNENMSIIFNIRTAGISAFTFSSHYHISDKMQISLH